MVHKLGIARNIKLARQYRNYLTVIDIIWGWSRGKV